MIIMTYEASLYTLFLITGFLLSSYLTRNPDDDRNSHLQNVESSQALDRALTRVTHSPYGPRPVLSLQLSSL